jgi:hypothetical protein
MCTHHSILNAEAELVLGIRSLDLHFYYWRTRNHCQLHHCLGFRIL